MWTKFQLGIAVLMVITGSLNTLVAKWADRTESKSIDGKVRIFHHPFFQALCMFIGEVFCLILFKSLYHAYKKKKEGKEDEHKLTKGNREFNVFVLYIPAACDMSATSVMLFGLLLTHASSYQMLRGALIVFTGLFSWLCLHRNPSLKQWIAIAIVILGLGLVGMADYLGHQGAEQPHSQMDMIIGDVLIVIAQIFTAIQMVVEEKYVAGLDIPALQAVGWEGIFGFWTLLALHIPLYFILVPPPFSNNARGSLEDGIDALVQIGNNWQLVIANIMFILSISFFNFAGISVTKEISAVTRVVLDSMRTLIIWIFSLLLFKQKFHWLQLLGFLLLLLGIFLYNNIIDKVCLMKIKNLCQRHEADEEVAETADSPDKKP